jgi:hypothetical protein
MLLNHGLNLHCLSYPTGTDNGCPAKNAAGCKIFGGAMQTEASERKTGAIAALNWPWAPESTPFEKWVETETSENLSYCQFGTKSS